jgi:hypothetical protein
MFNPDFLKIITNFLPFVEYLDEVNDGKFGLVTVKIYKTLHLVDW